MLPSREETVFHHSPKRAVSRLRSFAWLACKRRSGCAASTWLLRAKTNTTFINSTMTDEQTPTEAAATTEPVADETSPPENDAAAAVAVDGEKKGGKRGRKFEKKDEVPIEELFDLSQPIKRVR